MAQYKTGTCSVTNGSATVTFSGASSGGESVAPGDSFKVDRDGEAIHTINSRTPSSGGSITSITLSTNYGGTTGSGLNYQITVDFTPNRSYTEPAQGDADLADHLTQGVIRKIDTDMGNLLGTNKGRTKRPKEDVTVADGNNNDLAISATFSFVRLTGSPTAGYNVTGLTAGSEGDEILLKNDAGQTATLTQEDVLSAAANRFLAVSGSTFTVVNNAIAHLLYHESRWNVVAVTP